MKVAIVSGGTSGIGRGAVDTLLDEGFAVVTFSREKEKCDALAKELEGKEALVLTADVAHEEGMQSLVEKTVEKYGRIDVLVNNAGWGYWTSAEKGDMDTFRKMLETNTIGVATLTKHVIPVMKKQKDGQIIIISSIAGKQGYQDGAFYCATKHAVMGYTESIRIELKPHGIRVCTICPGMTRTNLFPAEVLEERKKATGVSSVHGGKNLLMDVDDISHVIKMLITQSKKSNIMDVTIRPS